MQGLEGEGEMPNDADQKTTETGREDSNHLSSSPASDSRNESTQSGAAAAEGQSSNTSRSQAANQAAIRISSLLNIEAMQRFHRNEMGPETQKMASLSPMQTPLLPLPLIAPAPVCPPPVRSISPEEFRLRLLQTIDEALRILDDDIVEGDAPSENDFRGN